MTASKLALLGTTTVLFLGLGLAPLSAQEPAEEEAYTPSGMATALGSDVENDDVIDRDKATAEYAGSGMATALGSDVEASPNDQPEEYTGSGMAAALGSDVEEPWGSDDVPKRLRQAELETIDEISPQ